MRKTRSRRRSSRRPQIAARWRFVAGFTLFALALAAAILFVGRPSGQPAVSDASLPQVTVAPDLPTVPAAVLDRAVYPYSIIEGGARSADELKQAIAGDPVVAAHYADFDLENTKVVRLEQPRLAHVSYRMGNAVYWTRKPLVIGAGETVLTDGVHVARTRCANQLAGNPGEISPAEPAAAVLDTPVKAAAASTPALSGPQPVAVNSSSASVAPSGGIGSSGTMSPGGSLPSGAPMAAAGAVGSGIQADEPTRSAPSSDHEPTGGSDTPPDPSNSGSNSSGSNPGSPVGLPPSDLPGPRSGQFPPLDGPILPANEGDPFDPPQPPNVPEVTTTPGVEDVTTIPEPGTTILMLGGAVAYAARRIRRKPGRKVQSWLG